MIHSLSASYINQYIKSILAYLAVDKIFESLFDLFSQNDMIWSNTFICAKHWMKNNLFVGCSKFIYNIYDISFGFDMQHIVDYSLFNVSMKEK